MCDTESNSQSFLLDSATWKSEMCSLKPLHIKTPLMESHPLSKLIGFPVYLKLENIQPVSSFKIRGIGHMLCKAAEKGCNHVVSSSGGNAGLAAAYASRKLGKACTVIVPQTTPLSMVERLRDEGATVKIHGAAWDEADQCARELAETPGFFYAPPFDHPDIWEGHSTLIHEVADSLEEKPSAVILSVGGGGLMCGVLQGMHDVGWKDVPLVAMETKGANSLASSLDAGEVVTLSGITSIAKTLGARRVAERAFRWAKDEHPVISEVISDDKALSACEKFADDHRMLVEPSCGASLAAVYCNLFQLWQDQGKLPQHLSSVVVVVCGGNMVTFKQLQKWKEKLGIKT